MTMQRSEYTDPDSSKRFPVVSSTSRSPTEGAPGGPAVGPAAGPTSTAAAATASAAATDVRHADVLSGRGKSYTKHYGNLRFDGTSDAAPSVSNKNFFSTRLDIIKQNLRRYFSVATHTEKKMITEEIVDAVTSLGRFLRYDKGHEKWIVMDREAARIKVAQALQYRQRRVAKGLESIDDSLEPNPLPPSHQGVHGAQHHIFQPIPEGAASIFSQDALLGLSQHSDGSQAVQQQPQHGEWGALQRHQQPNLSRHPQQQQHHRPSFDYDDDTSIGVAVVHRQMEQQQRDQQLLSIQLDHLLGQRRIQTLQSTSAGQPAAAATAAATAGSLHSVVGGPQYAGLGHVAAMDRQVNHGRNLHTAALSQEQHLQPLLALSLALEPRPVLFRANDVTVTGVPTRFGSSTQSTTQHSTSTSAIRATDHVSFRPIRASAAGNYQGQHRPGQPGQGQGHLQHLQATTLRTTSQPSAAASVAATAAAAATAVHHRQEEDSDGDANLAELFTEDVEDDPLVDGNEHEEDASTTAWDEPLFIDRHGS